MHTNNPIYSQWDPISCTKCPSALFNVFVPFHDSWRRLFPSSFHSVEYTRYRHTNNCMQYIISPYQLLISCHINYANGNFTVPFNTNHKKYTCISKYTYTATLSLLTFLFFKRIKKIYNEQQNGV